MYGQPLRLFVDVENPDSSTKFQWYRSNELINGRESRELLIHSVIDSDGGDYYCRVTNCAGSTDSQVARVSISNGQGPLVRDVPQTAGVSMEEWATGAEEIQRTRMSLVDSRCHHLLHLRQQMLLPLMRHHVSYYGISCGSLMGSNTYTCRTRRVNTCVHTLPFQLKWGSACSYLRMAAISD